MILNGDIEVEMRGSVVTVTLNRPGEMNAFTPEMAQALPGVFTDAVKNGARAIILTGAGEAFSSGASLGGGPTGQSAGAMMEKYYNPMATSIADLPVPLVTAVNGPAVGGGAGLALAGDIIIAARSSYIMLSFARIGLVPDCGATWLVARAAGRVRALQMALLAGRMPAEEALAAGLVTEVVDDGEVMERAEAVATQLAAMPTRTLALIRQQVRAALEMPFEDSLQCELDNQQAASETHDFKEGVASFKERRAPVFLGK